MHLELRDILAGKALRRRKVQDEAAIDDFAIAIAQAAKRRHTSGRNPSGDRFECESNLWARHAKHGDASAAIAGRQRGDRCGVRRAHGGHMRGEPDRIGAESVRVLPGTTV